MDRRARPAVASIAFLLLATPRTASPAQAAGPGERPRVGLVLSGGSARGIAHVGVLRALEESGLQVDFVAGTSMGAAIGALYASGYSADELAALVRSIDWPGIFKGRPNRSLVPMSYRLGERTPIVKLAFESWRLRLPQSSGSDYRIDRLLTLHLAGPSFAAGDDFDRLPIPFRAVAADLRTGARVVLARGSLDRAVRASMGTPVVLPPVRDGPVLLIDGGVVDNVPTDVAREMGAEVVIAVDTTTPPLPPETSKTAIGVAEQLLDVLSRARNQRFAREADVTIRPDLAGFSGADYGRFEELMARGYEAGRAAFAGLRARLGTPPRRRPGAPPAERGLEGRRVEAVEVEGLVSVRARLVRHAFGLQPGQPLKIDETLRGLDEVYATRLFSSNWLEFRPGGAGGVVVVVHGEEAPRRRIEAGAAYNESDRMKGFVRLKDRNLFGWGDRLEAEAFAGDEARGVEGSFMGERLLSAAGYMLQGRWMRDSPRFFRDREELGRAAFDRGELTAALQRSIGPAILVRAGLTAGRVEIQARPGPGFLARRDDLRIVRGAAVWDRLDDPDLPASGGRLELSGERSLSGLGASIPYWRAQGLGRIAVSPVRPSVIEARAVLGVSGGDVPAYDLFRIGGPAEIPGYRRGELWGRQAAAFGISHSLTAWRGLRLVARAGAGEVWETRPSISLRHLRSGAGLGVAAPTRIGPVALEWARSGGRSAVYFSVGFE